MVLAAASCKYEPPEPPDAAPDSPPSTGPFRQRAYLKASNAGVDDEFGSSVALSADGRTLAVGAPCEDSGATGVGGDQTRGDRGQSGAVYVFARPDTSAPWTQQAYVKASNTSENARFGTYVALSADGNTLAVAAQLESTDARGVNPGTRNPGGAINSGAAYVFTREGETWTEQAFIKASNAAQEDWFGSSLALSADGETLAVGAFYEDSPARGVNRPEDGDEAVNSGAVYVFARADARWSQQAYLKASDNAGAFMFGISAALSANGSMLAVGTGDHRRSVYVFTRSDTAWTQRALLTEPAKEFGAGLALSGDGSTLAVGASRQDSDRGGAYLFDGDGSTWTRRAYLEAPNADAGDQFGRRLALSATGSRLAVGAHLEGSAAVGIDGDQTDDTSAGSGAVYTFELAGNTWVRRYYVKASNTGTGDRFGSGVALSGDGSVLATGAPTEDSAAAGIGGNQTDNGATASGAVYVFR